MAEWMTTQRCREAKNVFHRRFRLCGIKENPVSDDHDSSSTKANVGTQCSLEDSGEYWRWCPRCGHELHNEKCKRRCPHCHYFMSCSDFD
jgi:hypothetical protein